MAYETTQQTINRGLLNYHPPCPDPEGLTRQQAQEAWKKVARYLAVFTKLNGEENYGNVEDEYRAYLGRLNAHRRSQTAKARLMASGWLENHVRRLRPVKAREPRRHLRKSLVEIRGGFRLWDTWCGIQGYLVDERRRPAGYDPHTMTDWRLERVDCQKCLLARALEAVWDDDTLEGIASRPVPSELSGAPTAPSGGRHGPS